MRISIGALAHKTGAKVQTIRYYEGLGLIPAPDRTAGGQRRYDSEHISRLSFIRHARVLGFSLAQVRELLDLADHPERDCAAADSIARTHLHAVKARIAALNSLKKELSRMVDHCTGKNTSECRVIETLANHDLCATTQHQALT